MFKIEFQLNNLIAPTHLEAIVQLQTDAHRKAQRIAPLI